MDESLAVQYFLSRLMFERMLAQSGPNSGILFNVEGVIQNDPPLPKEAQLYWLHYGLCKENGNGYRGTL